MTHYRFVKFWSQKAWGFFWERAWVFFKKLEFWHFLIFGREICSKNTKHWFFLARFAQILGILKFMMAISLPVHWIFWVKSQIATGSLNFGPKKALSFYICWVFFSLSFHRSGKKKPALPEDVLFFSLVIERWRRSWPHANVSALGNLLFGWGRRREWRSRVQGKARPLQRNPQPTRHS